VNRSLAAVVMAAGQGTRMRSSVPKHLHDLLGRRLVDWAVEPARPLHPSPFVVVVSPDSTEPLDGSLGDGVELVVQPEPRGTGDAVAAAREALAGFEGDVLVLSGDAPLLTTEELEALVDAHRRESAAVTLLTFEPVRPLPYGRVVRDERGAVQAVVEEADATAEERAIGELNSSIYVFASSSLWKALAHLEADNVQGELYLTDAVRHLVAAGETAAAHRAKDPTVGEGVNTRSDLALAARVLRSRIVRDHMLAGVTIADPETTWIEPGVEIEPDVVVQAFTILRGAAVLRAGAEVGPHAVVEDAEVGRAAKVGPFCYLRPGTVLADGARAGAFVEIKNSTVGPGAKVPHLSYVGDADIGEGTNVAAGNIMANYPHEPGKSKQRTKIGRNVRTGVHNSFVAPVEIGDDAWIGAGSAITEDVPPNALAIARARQVNKENYRDRDRDD
jgi:bifunctional UDP-N-acetylglucosamine pyrophosphorylase/glucosamine-1-phosphate N-acetyltransferase